MSKGPLRVPGFMEPIGETKTTKQIVLIIVALLGLGILGILLAIALGLY